MYDYGLSLNPKAHSKSYHLQDNFFPLIKPYFKNITSLRILTIYIERWCSWTNSKLTQQTSAASKFQKINQKLKGTRSRPFSSCGSTYIQTGQVVEPSPTLIRRWGFGNWFQVPICLERYARWSGDEETSWQNDSAQQTIHLGLDVALSIFCFALLFC